MLTAAIIGSDEFRLRQRIDELLSLAEQIVAMADVSAAPSLPQLEFLDAIFRASASPIESLQTVLEKSANNWVWFVSIDSPIDLTTTLQIRRTIRTSGDSLHAIELNLDKLPAPWWPDSTPSVLHKRFFEDRGVRPEAVGRKPEESHDLPTASGLPSTASLPLTVVFEIDSDNCQLTDVFESVSSVNSWADEIVLWFDGTDDRIGSEVPWLLREYKGRCVSKEQCPTFPQLVRQSNHPWVARINQWVVFDELDWLSIHDAIQNAGRAQLKLALSCRVMIELQRSSPTTKFVTRHNIPIKY